ncbi:MAG: shikimate dehydrogenase [Firmicutes bacterium]|nr:shikimate dehydrogenase [Bacillota bacterium]
MVEINGRTRACGLIGLPVTHSLSPRLHNSTYRLLGLNYRYLAFPVQPKELQPALRGITALNFAGVNVTAPYKEAVIPLIDRLSPAAAGAGSVNTICCRDGVLEGYSTDGDGFIRSLQEEGGFSPEGEEILLLGAGGAARAVAAALAARGTKRLIILNRTKHRAISLVDRLSVLFPSLHLETAPLTGDSIEQFLPQVSLVVNSLSEEPWPWERLGEPEASGVLAYDLRYSPPVTDFLEWAESGGAKVLNGLGMLLGQAALSFELFTGVKAPFALMESVVGDYHK